MTDAPERIWAAATKWAVGHGPDLDWRFGHWKATPVTVPEPRQEYLRADRALALLAEAYEVAARECEGSNLGLDPADVADDIRDLTPSDALAAREAQDKRVRDEALREVAVICNRSYGGSIGDVHKAILTLIESDYTDGRY